MKLLECPAGVGLQSQQCQATCEFVEGGPHFSDRLKCPLAQRRRVHTLSCRDSCGQERQNLALHGVAGSLEICTGNSLVAMATTGMSRSTFVHFIIILLFILRHL